MNKVYEYTNRIYNAQDYKTMEIALSNFKHSHYFFYLPYDTKKPKCWIDAFKGAGAYYSLMNLSQYSGLQLRNYKTNKLLNKYQSKCYLQSLIGNTSGYQLYALFKKAMEDNNFTLDTFKKICEETKVKRMSK